MKQVLILLISLTSLNSVYAQFGETHAIYSTQELNIGNYIGLDFGLNYIYKEKFSFKLGYSGNIRTAKSQPNDYRSFLGSPYDNYITHYLLFGKVYKLNEKGTIRINTNIGLGYTTIAEPINWIMDNYHQYIWTKNKYNTISFIINPKIEFPFSRFYGLTISPMVQISKNRMYFGIGFGEMLGLLRKKRN